jgi:tetratricopeptide (TPR) repeat protein
MEKMRSSAISAFTAALLFCAAAFTQVPQGGPPEGKQALAAGKFVEAKTIYESYLQKNPGNLPGELGLADALLGLHQYEDAELEYRKITAAQPELWIAHKNLVLIEAKLGRWDEFDRERELLRGARQREAPGISMRESDVIDSLDVNGKRWIVREYFEPVGRSLTRYNFEEFSPTGKAEEYISLESAQAAEKALSPEDTRIGVRNTPPPITTFALNFYNTKGHGTITSYPKGEPSYETVRAAVIRWLRRPAR